MKPFENYYLYLGISEDSTLKIIKNAYRKKSLLVHPDKLKVKSSDAFNKLRDIYVILSDPVKRVAYDKELNSFKKQEEIVSKQNEKFKRMREEFRKKEEEKEREKRELAKQKNIQRQKERVMQEDAEDVIQFDRYMAEKHRKRVEDLIKSINKPVVQEESEHEYTEDEVMKMMGL